MHGPLDLDLHVPSMPVSPALLSSTFTSLVFPEVVSGDLGGVVGEVGEVDGLVGAGPSGVRGPLPPR